MFQHGRHGNSELLVHQIAAATQSNVSECESQPHFNARRTQCANSKQRTNKAASSDARSERRSKHRQDGEHFSPDRPLPEPKHELAAHDDSSGKLNKANEGGRQQLSTKTDNKTADRSWCSIHKAQEAAIRKGPRSRDNRVTAAARSRLICRWIG